MIFRSFVFWVIALWGMELFLLPTVPLLSMSLDLLFLLLVFLGFRLPSARFLWLHGICLGLLKDLSTGGPFGVFALSFAWIGWMLGAGRHLVEREDPLLQGIWAGMLTLIHGLVYGLLAALADPAIGWNRWLWLILPAQVACSVGLAMWGFPRLQRVMG